MNIKVVVIGEGGVGKTSLINKYIKGTFNENQGPTNGASFCSKTLEINNEKYIADIWDTAGNNKYRALSKFFYTDADIIILVYDITNKKSFLELDFWLDSILKVKGKKVPMILVGNKSDLFENEKVSENDGRKLAQIIGAKFIYTNAQKSDLKEVFDNALINLIKSIKNI